MHIVAIDGPAGSGKSSVSKAVAKKLGYGYLDTGAAYRALTWLSNELGMSPSQIDEDFLSTGFDYSISLDPKNYWVKVGLREVTEAIRLGKVSELVSSVAQLPVVRKYMLELTRKLVLGADYSGVVVEGRDITTVIFPNAQTRILLTASEEVRLSRRAAELPEGSSVQEQITGRDKNDSAVVEFFRPGPGVELLDSTELDFDSTVEAICKIIQENK